ncbi:hypothetical protein NHH03_06530 [Stieleria sp. TO1_6]|uniref:GAP1-N2 domain-containing protein n=1 Tax=Stieleria tagensis TaxID=2956795 RepID=UPI00209B59A3|nr:hypothetical protein [Stieleria tagensis]MCO8121387.1 hypothetical protein [Stieleria tagensis]
MSHSKELIYTSAPRGLRAGSKGFCTVAMTAGLPAGLVGPLENLSAYRHVATQPSPVNFSHVRLTVAGRDVTVLSRVGDTVADYTGRTNKLAHHVIIDDRDRVDAGPAALLQSAGFVETTWNGEVGDIALAKSISAPTVDPRKANRWADVAGDAGWAGHVAALMSSKSPAVWVIHRPDQNPHLLEMVVELISILPLDRRWDVTFSTYCGEIPPGVTCRLRFVLAGTSLADKAVNPIDLTRSVLGSPPDSAAVTASRTGTIWDPAPVAAIPPTSIPVGPETAATAPANSAHPTLSDTVARPALPNRARPPKNLAPPRVPSDSLEQSHQGMHRRRLFAASMMAAMLALVFVGTGLFYVTWNNSTAMLDELTSAANLPVELKTSLLSQNNGSRSADLEQSDALTSPAQHQNEPGAQPASKPSEQTDTKAGTEPPSDELHNAKKLADQIQQFKSIKQQHDEFIQIEKSLRELLSEFDQSLKLETLPNDKRSFLKDQRKPKEIIDELYGSMDERFKKGRQSNEEINRKEKDYENKRSKLNEQWGKWNDATDNWHSLSVKLRESAKQNKKIESLQQELRERWQEFNSLDSFSPDGIEIREAALTKFEKKISNQRNDTLKKIEDERKRHVLEFRFDLNLRRNPPLKIDVRCPLTEFKIGDIDNCLIVGDKPLSVPSDGKEVKLEEGIYLIRTGKLYQIELRVSQAFHSKLLGDVLVIEQSQKKLIDLVSDLNKQVNGESPQNSKTFPELILNEINKSSEEDRDKRDKLFQEMEKKIKSVMRQLTAKESTKGPLDAFYDREPLRDLDDLLTLMNQNSVSSDLAPMYNKVRRTFSDYKRTRQELVEAYRRLRDVEEIDLKHVVDFYKADADSQIGQVSRDQVASFQLYFLPKLILGPDSRVSQ